MIKGLVIKHCCSAFLVLVAIFCFYKGITTYFQPVDKQRILWDVPAIQRTEVWEIKADTDQYLFVVRVDNYANVSLIRTCQTERFYIGETVRVTYLFRPTHSDTNDSEQDCDEVVILNEKTVIGD